jgi:putative oxidoreductase
MSAWGIFRQQGRNMRKINFLLQTSASLSDVPLVIARIALGVFFFATGFNKLLVVENQQLMLETITAAGIPFPGMMAVFVSFCECLFGVTLAAGIFTRPSALILFVISFVALLTVGIDSIPPGINLLTWYSWLLYLPETLYMLICLILMVRGGGGLSVDLWLIKKWPVSGKVIFTSV